jgi:putative endonuclease
VTKGGSVYILTNKLKTTLYIGVTADLQLRIRQHKDHFYKGSFSDQYNLEYCVYYENFFSIQEAIAREKQIKKWSRIKKENLINSVNPKWTDLSIELEKW